mmetsp:Transcript_165726/g.532122  ORF Transcript_165726/g.532122 Transcript_165726/m.532122 type:complete len:94 (-) Transcript_165726:379-660(-)
MTQLSQSGSASACIACLADAACDTRLGGGAARLAAGICDAPSMRLATVVAGVVGRAAEELDMWLAWVSRLVELAAREKHEADPPRAPLRVAVV